MKLEFDPEIENLLLQINTGNIEISHIYLDVDATNEMYVKKGSIMNIKR